MAAAKVARPKRGTVKQSALCAGCGGFIYRKPPGKWKHHDTWTDECPEEETPDGDA